ncbi:fumarylacetoacetate hydrolase family protein [Novosphingobium cyanobacteriorum]|uniref:Fumarylacetoacetate hydrolase family protein n=1 Tax=Novosphingobium cyanobacteriorum TaxID=3024215 RepID=A0ABT6CEB9_9SPHN|nr:fumarylacetoacetate hydrolase family protein [Novosphingobium cyanobacteriorum]MDF8332172.1 fumarylacetoacetate hydrolase family protein [Novosphingobium cyanobacteriorum]
MRLISFRAKGDDRFGCQRDDGIVDLTGRMGGARTLRELLAADGVAEARAFAAGAAADFAIGDCELLPVIPDPAKIICLGLNYRGHAEEVGKPLPAKPVVFHRHAQTLVAHGAPILKPIVSDKFDYEGELAVVLGKRGGHIPAERALEHVAGYCCFNEASVRDWQKHSHLYGMGKNFRATGAIGPWLVTADEIPDPQALELTTRLNGEEVQRVGISDLIFSIPELIAYVSQAIDWLPGDILVTGTPSGVGLFRDPPVFLKQGDRVDVEISQIGVLSNPVVNEAA